MNCIPIRKRFLIHIDRVVKTDKIGYISNKYFMNKFKAFFGKKRIYLDYASLTPIDERVLAIMKKYSSSKYANPSSWYIEGVNAKKVLDDSRKSVANVISAHSDEIIFTGGGTEANNIAILGAIEAQRSLGVEYKNMHIVTSAIEHSSVLECINSLKAKGVNVDIVGVNSLGIVDLDELKKKINTNTVLVSIMMVNNEVGSIQPIREIAKIIRRVRTNNIDSNHSNINSARLPLFHTDAAQGFLYEDINMQNLGVDMMTLDSGKVYGPRGTGVLYIKRDTPIAPVIFGGGQEGGVRSGTENIPSIAGFATALEIAHRDRQKESERINDLRKIFIQGLKNTKESITINGGMQSPHILNVSIPNIDNEFFVLQLDAKGIACSTKSSCLRDEDESYVLRAMGANSKNSIRFSIGRFTKKSDILKAIKIIECIILA